MNSSKTQQSDTAPRATGHGAGKKTSSMKAVSQTAPPTHQPTSYDGGQHTNGRVNGINGQVLPPIKLEDQMDEGEAAFDSTTRQDLDDGVDAVTLDLDKLAAGAVVVTLM